MKKYCLDTNVFIEAWNKYYSMKLSPGYWDVLDDLAQKGIIFCTQEVKYEIEKVDDKLTQWIKTRNHFFKEITENVQSCLRNVLQFERLVDSSKTRSVADPWVIAHAMAENAVVVTKEEPTPLLTKRIKIPDVCKELKVKCINDFQFLNEIGIQFDPSLKIRK